LLRRGQDKLRQALPGGFMGGRAIALIGAAIVAAWLGSGFYTVAPNEVGLNMVFGRFVQRTSAGLNYNWPYPIGSVTKLGVTDRNAIDVGFVTRENRRLGAPTQTEVPEESLMLTGDENIADVKFRVIWQIDPLKPEDYAFNVRNPPETVKAVAESAMREIVGRTPIQRILTAERKVIEPAAQDLIQKVLNDYNTGVIILQVQLLSVDPPEQVIAAFRDVTAAQQDQDRLRNEAEAYANRVVPEARGQAAQIVQQAEGYKEQTVAEARGQAAAFDQIYQQYKNAPAVTRERMYLETMERVLGSANKVIVDQKNGASVLPYLPLSQLEPAAPPPAQPQQQQQRPAPTTSTQPTISQGRR
jgi:membrane protease subunit HflK